MRDLSHLADLRQHAARTFSAAIKLQRLVAARLKDAGVAAVATEIEVLACNTLMKLARAAQSLYARELDRCSAAALAKAAQATRS
jgi:hypothetical protein